MPHKWMAPVGNLAHLWNFTVSKYWLKLRVCRQKSPLLLSCWKRTWLHFQSHPSSAQMEIDEELRSWEIVPSSLNRIEIPGAFEVEHHDKLTRMTYYAVSGIQNKDKRNEWIPCFSWWSPWMITQQVPIFPNLEQSFCGQKNHWVSPTGLQDHPRVAKIQVDVPVFSTSCPWQKLCICRTSQNTLGCYFYK